MRRTQTSRWLTRWASLRLLLLWLLPLPVVAAPPPSMPRTVVERGSPKLDFDGVMVDARGFAVSPAGDIWVADTGQSVVRKYSSQGELLLTLGRHARAGDRDGNPGEVRFRSPSRIAWSRGALWVLDDGQRVRRIDARSLRTETLVDLSEFEMPPNLRALDIAAGPNGAVQLLASDPGAAEYRLYLLEVAPEGPVEGPVARASWTSETSAPDCDDASLTIARNGDRLLSFGCPSTEIRRYRQASAQEGVTGSTPIALDPNAALGVLHAGPANTLYFTTNPSDGLVRRLSIDSLRASPDLLPMDFCEPGVSPSCPSLVDVGVGPMGGLFVLSSLSEEDASVSAPALTAIQLQDGVEPGLAEATPPQITLLQPANDAIVAAPSLALAIASDDDPGLVLQFWLDERSIGPPQSESPFELPLDPAYLSAGGHRLRATATDAAGTHASSESVRFWVEEGLPRSEGEIVAGAESLARPHGIGIGLGLGADASVYVGDGALLKRFARNGKQQPEAAAAFGEIAGVGRDSGGRLYVLDAFQRVSGGASSRISLVDPSTGSLISRHVLDSAAMISARGPRDLLSGGIVDLLASPPLQVACTPPTIPSGCYFRSDQPGDIAPLGASSTDGALVSLEGMLAPEQSTEGIYFVYWRPQGPSMVAGLARPEPSDAFEAGHRGIALDATGTLAAFPVPDEFGSRDRVAHLEPAECGTCSIGSIYAGASCDSDELCRPIPPSCARQGQGSVCIGGPGDGLPCLDTDDCPLAQTRCEGRGIFRALGPGDIVYEGEAASTITGIAGGSDRQHWLAETPAQVLPLGAAQDVGAALQGTLLDQAMDLSVDSAGSVWITSRELRSYGDDSIEVGRLSVFAEVDDPRPAADFDQDGVLDDGDGSGFPGDSACSSDELFCDDNCLETANPDQLDTDSDREGDACDATPLPEPARAFAACALAILWGLRRFRRGRE